MESEFVCNFCGNIFNNNKSLIRHQKKSIKCKKEQERITINCSKCSNKFIMETDEKIYCNDCFMANIIFLQNEKLKNEVIQLKEIINKLILENESINTENKQLILEKEFINTEKGQLIIKVAQLEGKLSGIFESLNIKPLINANNNINNNNNNVTLNNTIYVKLKNLDISTIEPFILETVEKRLKNDKYSYGLFQKRHPGVSEFLKLIVKKGEERSYVCNDPSRKKFYRLFTKNNENNKDSDLPEGWVKDYGAEFLKKIIPMLEPYAYKYKLQELKEIGEEKEATFDGYGDKDSDNEYKQLLKQQEEVNNFYKCFCCSKKTGMPKYPTEHSKLLKYLINDLKTFAAI